MTTKTKQNASNKGFFIEPIRNVDRVNFIEGWLDGDITTKDFKEFLAKKTWVVEYK